MSLMEQRYDNAMSIYEYRHKARGPYIFRLLFWSVRYRWYHSCKMDFKLKKDTPLA